MSLLWSFLPSDSKESPGRRQGIMDLLSDFVSLGRQVTGYSIVLTLGELTFHVDTWSDSVREKTCGISELNGFLFCFILSSPFIQHCVGFIGPWLQ